MSNREPQKGLYTNLIGQSVFLRSKKLLKLLIGVLASLSPFYSIAKNKG